MATIAYIILFLTLSSTTIHARESQFFAKVSNNNNPKETQPLNTNQNYIPQAQEVPYGHESGQLPPSATNNNNNNLPKYLPENYNPVAYTTPIHSTTQDIPEEYREEPAAFRYNGESSMYNSQKQQQGFEDARFMDTEEDGGNNMYNNKQEVGTNDENMYNYEKQGMSDTRLLDNGKYYYNPGGNGYNSQKQGFEDTRFMETENGDNMYNSQKQGTGEYGTSNNANMYNNVKQGMSDTRFLENGKYYYDINMENNANTNMNSRGFNSRNEYNTQGYYGNNENENSYDRYNSNGGYQNQEEFQGEQFNP
ncbi:putative protein E6 [Helianthus annuus]|uniref:Protein E6 n=1 Tax=Helianthus annuus TaxID=4232 RepID=A0A9K3E0X5_HELAN|nr:probable serine/threonine-protein kinase clkA [Helianthus annuus]KAF5764947.1 putative protein E6 [Helianthus annuus]KAJ0456103.1 putative protein E6 [Helianthus annuus]KAJ0831663.1 putative protein E6 [Helianthus annuus]KAJ0845123.1 putative protein E6 [Helianthus annuus]